MKGSPAEGVTSQPEVVVSKPEAKREGGGLENILRSHEGVKRDGQGITDKNDALKAKPIFTVGRNTSI